MNEDQNVKLTHKQKNHGFLHGNPCSISYAQVDIWWLNCMFLMENCCKHDTIMIIRSRKVNKKNHHLHDFKDFVQASQCVCGMSDSTNTTCIVDGCATAFEIHQWTCRRPPEKIKDHLCHPNQKKCPSDLGQSQKLTTVDPEYASPNDVCQHAEFEMTLFLHL